MTIRPSARFPQLWAHHPEIGSYWCPGEVVRHPLATGCLPAGWWVVERAVAPLLPFLGGFGGVNLRTRSLGFGRCWHDGLGRHGRALSTGLRVGVDAPGHALTASPRALGATSCFAVASRVSRLWVGVSLFSCPRVGTRRRTCADPLGSLLFHASHTDATRRGRLALNAACLAFVPSEPLASWT